MLESGKSKLETDNVNISYIPKELSIGKCLETLKAYQR
jgi:hypothetical protein